MSRVKRDSNTLSLIPYFNETRKIRRARKGLHKLLATLKDAGLPVDRGLFPSDSQLFTTEIELLELDVKNMSPTEIVSNAATIARLATQ